MYFFPHGRHSWCIIQNRFTVVEVMRSGQFPAFYIVGYCLIFWGGFMNKKRIFSIFLAFLVIFSFGISLRAFKIGIPDIIEAADNYDTSANPSYNLSAWNALTSSERSSALESLIISHGGTPTLKPGYADSDRLFHCRRAGH